MDKTELRVEIAKRLGCSGWNAWTAERLKNERGHVLVSAVSGGLCAGAVDI
jgi:hypothetical protein